MQDLSDKTVLVTGASKGIGAESVRSLGRAGARVVAHYSADKAGAEAAVADIDPGRCCLVQADFNNLAEAERAWDEAWDWAGGIDVFVNNAAMMVWNGGFDVDVDSWDEAWEQTLQVNVLAPARLLRRAVRGFLENGGGIIVTISSWAAQKGVTNPDTIAYGASKAAIHNTTQTIARAFAARGILAYVVAPGIVDTRLSRQFAETQGGAEAVSAALAMKEWVPPEEIGELVTFLATGRVRHLTGATLDINGASYIR
jgi:NAD(P)-dependent dehydrogenase (short-subunit alcohol dehydrogenase family)